MTVVRLWPSTCPTMAISQQDLWRIRISVIPGTAWPTGFPTLKISTTRTRWFPRKKPFAPHRWGGVVHLARIRRENGRGRKTAADINNDFLDWLSDQEGGRPFFVFLNYFDAHSPYIVPDESSRHFGRVPATPAEVALLQDWENRPKQNVPESDATLASDAYDDCIGYLDTQIGKLMDELKSRGVLDNTLVVITSDHGEELGEHGLFGHGRSLYSQELHVPLVSSRLEARERAGLSRAGQSLVTCRPRSSTCWVFPGFTLSREIPGSLLEALNRTRRLFFFGRLLRGRPSGQGLE